MSREQKLDIAVGHSRTSKAWKNKKITWSELKTRLAKTIHTSETVKEFLAASKTEQSNIKDVGGYVGGYLRGGRRKPTNVLHRQLLTFDLDFANIDFWEDFQMMFNCAAVLHGTHKNTKDDAKFRLVMPLTREVSAEEYQAISRYVAGAIGIELFDPTTFQSERLMYWPSTPCDVDYYYQEQDGGWLDADEVLKYYVDWTDSSSWPTSAKVEEEVSNKIGKQEDPTDKKGLIGAFCRAYTIDEAIETFLSDEYTPCDGDRYTYTKGTAAAGLVVYDSKFAYSHHGTDPASSKLCNSFDLVRLHLYGHLDDPLRSEHTKPKSVAQMEELARSDNRVKKTIAEERIDSSKFDFAEDYEAETEEAEGDPLAWVEDLEIDTKGKYLSTASNIALIFKNDKALKKAFVENIFDNKRYAYKSLPWRKIDEPEPLKNVDYSGVRSYLETTYGITGAAKIDDGLNLEFQKNNFHPIRDFLKGLKWDGVDRIDGLLGEFFGADDNQYTREAIRKMLVAAVARVFVPGTKFDLVLTLVGAAQGTGKSTFIAKLGKSWFSDSFHTVQGKEAFEQLQGAWLIEMAELSGIRKNEIEAVKHFITKTEDQFRPAYGRTVETFKRSCIFFATTNKFDFLQDSTGNRRFLPIDVHETKAPRKSWDLKEDEINQIWAEAVELYHSGEPLYLSAEAEKIARGEQRNHSQTDDREGMIVDYLDTFLPANWDEKTTHERRRYFDEFDELTERGKEERQFVCVAEIWAELLNKDLGDLNRYSSREINEILRGLDNWRASNSTRNFKIYGKQKYYERI